MRSQRGSAACTSALLSVCASDPTLALICLTYAPAASASARGRAHAATTDTFLARCDGEAIATAHVTAAPLAHETPTAAAWVSEHEAVLGTAAGALFTVQLRQQNRARGVGAVSTASGGSSALRVKPPVVTKACGLHQFARRVCGITVLSAAADAQTAPGHAGPAAAESSFGHCCVLVATASALLCFPGSGSVHDVLGQYDSATAVAIGAAIELDSGVQPCVLYTCRMPAHAFVRRATTRASQMLGA